MKKLSAKLTASTSNFRFYYKVDRVLFRQNGSGGRNLRSGKGTKFEVFARLGRLK